MKLILNNPVYHALVTGDKELAKGSGRVRYFDESVSPFAGIDDGYEEGFEELFRQLPEGRKILYATPQQIMVPEG
ncbi:MAG: hypothetical protein ACXWB9_06615, partial [Flavisolibacter sp.]